MTDEQRRGQARELVMVVHRHRGSWFADTDPEHPTHCACGWTGDHEGHIEHVTDQVMALSLLFVP